MTPSSRACSPRRFAACAYGMVLAVAAVILPPSGRRAAAQEPDTIEALVPGHRSISLNLPDGGGAMFGIW